MIEGIYPLNQFVVDDPNQDDVSAMSVTFKRDAKLCKFSGIRFYSDPFGINEICKITAGKKDMVNLPPFLFK